MASASGEALDELPLVPRLLLQGLPSLRGQDLWLVRGRTNDKEQSQIAAGAPGSELEERRLPLAVWKNEQGLVLAPQIVLERSEEYTFLALGSGAIARVATGPTASPLWWRWGSSEVTAGGWVVHCSERPPWALFPTGPDAAAPAWGGAAGTLEDPSPEAGARASARLEPGAVEVQLHGGVSGAAGAQNDDARACVRFQLPGAEEPVQETLLPPHTSGGRFFEPSALFLGAEASSPASSPVVRVSGSAAFLELTASFAEASVVSLVDGRSRGSSLLVQAPRSAALLLGVFEPGPYRLLVSTVDGRGLLERHLVDFDVGAEEGHPVLTEILTNPLGPEPAAEWVEIMNIGRAPLSLAGYALEDAETERPLPPVVLEAGAVGLLVGPDFVVASAGDVVPSARAVPIVLDDSGDGLTNAGESVRLRAPSGEVISEIPAHSGTAGRSFARRHLLAPDWPTSFGHHGPPGASPGGSNVFE